MQVEVNLDFTPNPDTLKYSVNQSILARGAVNFTDASEAKSKSLLAEELFAIDLVSAVMLGTNFVTVTLSSHDDLRTTNEKIVTTIRSFLESGKNAIEGDLSSPSHRTDLSEIEQKIAEVLDQEVRPAVAMDGGDIELEKYQDGIVYLKMQGSCAGCPSSLMTLKHGVETRLKEKIPEIEEVIPV